MNQHQDQPQVIVDRGDLRKYRIEIPNIYDDSDLDPYQFRLLVHYKRVGYCREGLAATARKCRMSVGKVSEVRQWLADKGYISLTPIQTASGPGFVVEVVDKWEENFYHYSTKKAAISGGAKPSSGEGLTGKPSPDESKPSPHEGLPAESPHVVKERKNGIKKKPMEEGGAQPPVPFSPPSIAAGLRPNAKGLTALDVQQAWLLNHQPPSYAAEVAAEFGDGPEAEIVRVFIEETGLRFSRSMKSSWLRAVKEILEMGYNAAQVRSACQEHAKNRLSLKSPASIIYALPKGAMENSAQAALTNGASVSAVNAALNRGRQ